VLSEQEELFQGGIFPRFIEGASATGGLAARIFPEDFSTKGRLSGARKRVLDSRRRASEPKPRGPASFHWGRGGWAFVTKQESNVPDRGSNEADPQTGRLERVFRIPGTPLRYKTRMLPIARFR